MCGVLNGNVVIIKFLFRDIDKEKNKKMSKISSVNGKMKKQSLMVEEKVAVLNARLCWHQTSSLSSEDFNLLSSIDNSGILSL